MPKIFMIAGAFLMMMACNSQGDKTKDNSMQTDTANSSGTGTLANGWIPLFDGKTTNGWHKYGGWPRRSSVENR